MGEKIELKEKKEYILEIEPPQEKFLENQVDTPKQFNYSKNNDNNNNTNNNNIFGNDLENEMSNLKINPKKRRMDDDNYDKFQIKKIH